MREGAAGQGSSQLVEGAVGSLLAHRCPLSPKGGTRQPRLKLINEDKYEGLQGLAQLPRILLAELRRTPFGEVRRNLSEGG